MNELNKDTTHSGRWKEPSVYHQIDPYQIDPSSIRADGGAQGTDGCNESKHYNNAEKAVFHAIKGSKRFKDDGRPEEAARVAANAGKAFLLAEDIDYDDDLSSSYLQDLIEKIRSDETGIEKAIDKAFSKIDSGNHTGGARIAVSIGERYVDQFGSL
jgi:hypothetical protein